MLEKSEKGPESPGLEEEVPPAASASQEPAFVKTLLNSSPYYKRLRKKMHVSTTTAPYHTRGIPFFEGHAMLPEIVKSFLR